MRTRSRSEQGEAMFSLDRILVPIDFSECSRVALDYAADMAERLFASLDVLHVWEPPPDLPAGSELLRWFERSDAGEQMKEALARYEGRAMVRVRGRLQVGDPC